ncbi:protein hook homolog [Zerene cesonia]|uniref:protein hook homolog n=1 Tax=Zerene cesonia TaxID=33412 RepID=UPI0018E56C2D|nr:protein hook homolog [Zerene cesonia]
MSLDLDDPLAGILSDGSDDSFFDDDIMGKKKTSKSKDTATVDKKKALFDLDSIQATKTNKNISNEVKDIFESSNKDKEINLASRKASFKIENNSKTISSPAPMKRTFSKDSVSQNNDNNKLDNFVSSPSETKMTGKSAEKLDLLDDLLEDKKSIKTEKGKSSQSLLDDILGGPSLKSSSNQQKNTAFVKNSDVDFDSLLGKTELKQTLLSNNTTKPLISQKKEIKDVENTKVKQVQPKSSTEDWLGIFKDKDEAVVEDEADMPSWLTGGVKKNKTDRKAKPVVELTEETTTKAPDIGTHTVQKEEYVSKDGKLEELMKPQQKSTLEISNDDVTLEGAALCLQQQEAQLMVALQLKAQDDKLAAMQERQKETQRVQRETTMAHHEQLDAMLRRQAEHRQQMQAIIASHQDRINQRIKALLINSNDNDGTINDEIEKGDGSKESPYTREKKQLIQLVQSLQENHDKEIDLMETSYRRQLDFLELSYTQAEERMKEETEKLVKFYSEKISWLDEHHQLYKKMAEDNLSELTERHKAENDMLRQQHLDNVKVLQEHHAALMENIRNAVKQEQVLIKDSAGFSSDLQILVTDVKENNKKCEHLYDKVESLVHESQHDAVKSLQIREKQINDIIEQLKKDREDFERDKAESKDIVKMLESRLRQMTTMMEEKTASLRQKKMDFEFEKATFSKQTEFAKNVLKKQDEELKMQKEDLQKEYQDKLARIEEEKTKAVKDSALVAKEKASIQSLKLEIEKTKAELDAHLQEVTEERSKLNAEKQELHIEEQRIMAKSRDLDLLAKSAIERQSQAEKKLSEANFIQQKYEDRIRRIQEHVVSLNMREKQIAKEKVALSRERLTLHNERKELENKQCSLCRGTNQAYLPEPIMPMVHFNRDYNAPRDYRRTFGNMNSNINDIEMEVSQLMGRPFLDERTEFAGDNVDNIGQETLNHESGRFKSHMDPKFMMLRLDVQRVINNLDRNKQEDEEHTKQENP